MLTKFIDVFFDDRGIFAGIFYYDDIQPAGIASQGVEGFTDYFGLVINYDIARNFSSEHYEFSISIDIICT